MRMGRHIWIRQRNYPDRTICHPTPNGGYAGHTALWPNAPAINPITAGIIRCRLANAKKTPTEYNIRMMLIKINRAHQRQECRVNQDMLQVPSTDTVDVQENKAEDRHYAPTVGPSQNDEFPILTDMGNEYEFQVWWEDARDIDIPMEEDAERARSVAQELDRDRQAGPKQM